MKEFKIYGAFERQKQRANLPPEIAAKQDTRMPPFQPEELANRPATRAAILGYLDKPNAALSPRHALLAHYMVNGCPHDGVTKLVDQHGVPLQMDKPLSLVQAADVLRIKRRAARHISGSNQFQHLMRKLLAELRNGEAAASIHTIIDVRDDPGENKAADRKVRMQAAQSLLGESQSGTQVNVQINNGNATAPGYIIQRRPEPRQQPDAANKVKTITLLAMPASDALNAIGDDGDEAQHASDSYSAGAVADAPPTEPCRPDNGK